MSNKVKLLAVLSLLVPFSNVTAQKIGDYLSIGGFIETQYDIESKQGNDTDLSTFQVRRARLDIKGNIDDQLSFRMQSEFAGSAPKILDAFVKYKFNKYAAIQVGQFKTPFSLENAYASLNMESIEFAQSISKLAGYKDVSGVSSYSAGRDIGIQLSGSAFQKDGQWDILSYYVGLFNGNGINTKDCNTDKDFSAKIELRPIVKELVLSGSIYNGNYTSSDVKNADRNRYSAGFEYKDKRLTVRSEYLNGKTGLKGVSGIKNQTSNGFYATAGYWFNFTCNNGDVQKIRPVARFDYYDNDSDIDNDESTNYMVGFDWWPKQNLRLFLNYTIKDQKSSDKLGHSLAAMMSIKF